MVETLRIDRLASSGEGVGRLKDGMAVFVAGTAPGDRVEARIVQRRRRHARAELVHVLEAGPARTAPRCEVFGRCGGCAWQHVDYSAQLTAKQAILADALRRIGGVELDEAPSVVPSPRPFGYRGRARVVESGGVVGYRERGSHAVCGVSSCPILLPVLDRALAGLSRSAAEPGDEGRASAETGGMRGRGREDEEVAEWELAAGTGGEWRATRVGAPPSAGGHASGSSVTLQVAGDALRVSEGTFAQSNALMLDVLHTAVCRMVGSGGSLLELYAGAGFFTLTLARRFASVQVVESAGPALEDLDANLRAAGIGHVRIIAARVEDALARGVEGAPEVVLLDPPRSGLARRARSALGALGAERIVYLSCDPATLARDVAALGESGYVLEGVEGFDLFPQTPHVEALAMLTRRGA